MADNEGTEQSGAEATEGFHVNLSENADATVFVDSEEEADTPEATTEPEADGDTEQSADAAEEKPTPPTAEELGYDLKNPKDKAAFDAMLRKWTKWANRFDAKHKESTKAEPAPPEPQAPAEAQQNGWDPYTVPLDEFVYDGGSEPDDSGIAGFEKEIDRRVTQGVKKAIEFTLNQMRVNDGRLREQQQVGTAQERIASYAQALQAHPEYEEKAALVAKIAKGTRDLAIQDPEEWISMVEARTGIYRNWREEAEVSSEQRGQQNQRLANKPRAVVQRPTQTGRPALQSMPRGNMTVDDAFEAAWRARR